ncbi:MAG: VWA domain-containing protein, partial [Candidatus Competibacteraceae bacterium]|nr:VWA domain-containing protein [Candidatus Competibacteraceae bacterium]
MSDRKLPTPSSDTEVNRFLEQVASLPVSPGPRGRLIFALDATASRQPTWDQACQLQNEMFQETARLGGLTVQLAWYRGFKEFQTSSWVSDPRELTRIMEPVHCVGGMTQIGRVLHHAVDETRRHRINALVLVGDCMEENPDTLQALAGELGLLGVPVFVFHEGGEPRAAATFRQIARLSRGAYCAFDAGSARQLRELLS